jgi:putative ABC transport system substrate-binding protein
MGQIITQRNDADDARVIVINTIRLHDPGEDASMYVRPTATAALLVALLTSVPQAAAQSGANVARIGWLGVGAGVTVDSFRQGMRERGWTEGQNLIIETRFGDYAQAPQLVAELQRAQVALIVAQRPMVLRARDALGTTPVVFGFSGDPVEARLVTSLGRPGGNMTGLTAMAWELVGKRLELLQEALPGVKRVAILANPAHPGEQSELRISQEAARKLGVTVQYLPVRTSKDIEAAFDAMVRERAQAVIAFPDAFMNGSAKVIAELAARRGIPVISGAAQFAEAGNFMTYGPVLGEFWRSVSYYADKVLKGARPGDLPVGQPTTFELVVNLKVARALGVSVPQSLLLRADRVIE